MLPAQDSLSKNSSFGNLIALPLQGKALQDGNSAFIDCNWNAYSNQWEILFRKPRLSQEFLEEKIKEWSNPIDDIVADADESDREKPWNRIHHFNKNDVQTVDKVALEFTSQSNFSFMKQILYKIKFLRVFLSFNSPLFSLIFASFFKFIHAYVSPTFISIRAFPYICVYRKP